MNKSVNHNKIRAIITSTESPSIVEKQQQTVLVARWPGVRFARVVCPNNLGLVLPCILRLAERKSTVLAHPLRRTDLLDRFLEPAAA